MESNMAEQAPQNITIDGISYAVDQFSQQVQQAVAIYNAINLDLQKSQLETIKAQAALQNIGAQITEAVKKELTEKAEAVATSAGAAAE